MKWLGLVPTLIGIFAMFSGLVVRGYVQLLAGVVLTLLGTFWLFSGPKRKE